MGAEDFCKHASMKLVRIISENTCLIIKYPNVPNAYVAFVSRRNKVAHQWRPSYLAGASCMQLKLNDLNGVLNLFIPSYSSYRRHESGTRVGVYRASPKWRHFHPMSRWQAGSDGVCSNPNLQMPNYSALLLLILNVFL